MNKPSLESIEKQLRLVLGRGSSFETYDRGTRTPLNFVWDKLERRLGRTLPLFWVSGGSPEIFCLSGAAGSAVVFNRRYVEISGLLRQLLTLRAVSGDLLVELAERVCLQLIAELSLRYGDSDLAVLAYMRSKAGQTIVLADDRSALSLEYTPIGPAYMMAWFFGLAHEVGHVYARDRDIRALVERVLPDAEFDRFRDEALRDNPLPDGLEQRVRAVFDDPGSVSHFNRNNLREEVAADLFACQLMLESTIDIMAADTERAFDPIAFAVEHELIMNVVSLITRCERVAALARADTDEALADVIAMAFMPEIIGFRAALPQKYLEVAIAGLREDSLEPSEQACGEVRRSIDLALQPYQDRYPAIQAGFRAAIRFARTIEDVDEAGLVEQLRRDRDSSAAGLLLVEAREFCRLAESMGAGGRLLETLQALVSSQQD